MLVFDGPNEFGPNPWVIIPDAVDPDEVKACYVATTQQDIFRENVSPGPGWRVTEIDPLRPGLRDYRYNITARPAALAVWAICGLENERTYAFLPYAMGVRQNVVAGPSELVENVDIRVDVPLDHATVVRLRDTPDETVGGPDYYRVDAYLDLGGEGVLAREDRSVLAAFPEGDFRLVAQPPLMGTLGDARWLFVGGAYTSDDDGLPLSVVVERNVVDTNDPIVLDGFLGVPILTVPPVGGDVRDNTVTWEADGGMPTFNWIAVDTVPRPFAGRVPVWRVLTRGDVTTFRMPALDAIFGIYPPPDGQVSVVVWSVRTDTFGWNEFSYFALMQEYWDAWAVDVFVVGL